MSDYKPRTVDIGTGRDLPFDVKGRALMGKHSADDNAVASETATLRAQLQTLQGRIGSLERRIEKMTEREQAVRRAVGQLAHAFDVIRK